MAEHRPLQDQLDTARQESMAGLDMPWLLAQWATRQPHKACLIWAPFNGPEQTWTYQQLFNDATQVATGLHQRGVRAGEFVIIHLDNSPEFVVA
jgi:carnitine-CoA ligase